MEAEIKEIRSDIREIKESLIKMNGKVRSLEVWRGVMVGMGIVLSIIIIPVVLILVEKSL